MLASAANADAATAAAAVDLHMPAPPTVLASAANADAANAAAAVSSPKFPLAHSTRLTQVLIPDAMSSLNNTIADYVFMCEFGSGRGHVALEPNQRWVLCDCVYVVWQSDAQVGAAKNLEGVHCQMRLDDFFLQAEILIRGKEHNQERTKIIYVGKSGVNDELLHVASPSTDFDVPRMLNLLEEPLKFQDCSMAVDGTSRQRAFVDLGHTANRDSARRLGCYLGLTRPRLFRHTKQAPVDIWSMMDKVRQETGSSQVMMDHEVPTTRLDQFARRIDAANQFEAMRVHKTHAAEFKLAMCEPHTDKNNSCLGLLSAVVWFSALARRADGTLASRSCA
jgi:hypothetical protein